MSAREFWGVVHGMVLGALFLLAYGGGLAKDTRMRMVLMVCFTLAFVAAAAGLFGALITKVAPIL